ncbi:MAG: DNA-directed RNA polymerase subunit omega [Acidobacteria bacterium]|nr:DNA-directed RNA polymerase subunit omega [Acidobacteriota bacterium]
MTFNTPGMGRFEFVKIAALRTAQLVRGSTPRVATCLKPTTTAQREVAAGKICRDLPAAIAP